MNIVLLGPSGAGKGTQALKLVPDTGMLYISTGDIFRESLENQTKLGIVAKRYMDQGELVPDEVVEAMVELFVRKADPEKGIIFDGFPRTLSQAKFLDELLHDMGRTLDVVIYLKASDDEVVERLPDRMICGQCQMPFHKKHAPFKSCPYGKCQGQYLYQRDDDQPKIIRARLRAFHRATASLAHYYQEQSKLIILNGQHSIEQVHQAILDELHAVDRAETRTASPEEAAKIHALKDVRPALAEDQAKHPSLDIILLGAPGSGKGTQAVQLGKLLNLKRIATGDLFRKNIEERTRLGMIAKKYMDRGELVPDNVTESMVRDRLSRDDTQRGFILDGFPRTLPQAEALTEIMTDMNRRISVVVYMNVSDEEIVDRLSGRIICRKCQSPFHEKFNPFETCPYNQCQGEHLYQREDDKPKTVRTRLRTYHRQTAPLIEYYSNDGLLVEVNGVGDVSDIFNHVVAAIQEVTKVELA